MEINLVKTRSALSLHNLRSKDQNKLNEWSRPVEFSSLNITQLDLANVSRIIRWLSDKPTDEPVQNRQTDRKVTWQKGLTHSTA